MENAQLISLSRQLSLQRQMDVVANNLANINTTGFKGEDLLFEDYVMPVAADDDFMPVDRDLHYTWDWSTVHDMANGSIEQTGNPLDVALSGNGFLVVETPQGERYTRAGSLQIASDGTLVDLDGNPVLSDQGPIRFEPTETDINIASNGSISTSEGAKGALRLVEFADPRMLAKAGNNLYTGDGGAPAIGTRVVQGSIERSNVSGVTQLTEMIRIQRAYQSLASLMQKQDDIRSTAINRLGDLNA
jgi:flagellar basal-body rod protein FlgF